MWFPQNKFTRSVFFFEQNTVTRGRGQHILNVVLRRRRLFSRGTILFFNKTKHRRTGNEKFALIQTTSNGRRRGAYNDLAVL